VPIELIVVDNASTDKSQPPRARHPRGQGAESVEKHRLHGNTRSTWAPPGVGRWILLIN